MPPSVLVIDTTPAKGSTATSSLALLESLVEDALADSSELVKVTTLKMVGNWNLKPPEFLAPPPQPQRMRSDSAGSESDTHLQSQGLTTPPQEWEGETEKEWVKGTLTVKKLLERLTSLESLE